jgi:hypothetical protein
MAANRQSTGQLADARLGGGLNSAISGAQAQPYSTGAPITGNGFYNFSQYGLPSIQNNVNESDTISTVKSLYDLKNAQTNDNSVKAANLSAELAWLESRPETIARDQQIVSLMDSIDQLKKATDSNTAATQATLNPLYSQGHGALAIGYYKAATGIEGIVGGSGGTDSTEVRMMLTPGEHLKVTPQGQSSNDNSRQTTIIQNFYGGATSTQRRSRRQAEQGFAQSMLALA